MHETQTAFEHRRFETRLSKEGKVSLPSAVRREAGLNAGDQLLVSTDGEGRIVLETIAARLARIQDMAAKWFKTDGRSMVDALIAERREEARREEADS